jgi:hypothetical protein
MGIRTYLSWLPGGAPVFNGGNSGCCKFPKGFDELDQGGGSGTDFALF